MTIVLTVLLAVLEFVGWLLLFLLALLVALLILPVELRFAYQAGKPSLTAWYGPLHFTPLATGRCQRYGCTASRRAAASARQHNQALNQHCLKRSLHQP